MPPPSQTSRSRPPASGPRAKRVFISHSSKNKPVANAVVAELESNGIPCWISSRDIRPGEPNYGKAILDGLSACHAVVLLLTEASNRSQHVMKEAERAVNRNVPILVVKFQPVNVSRDLEYYVSSAQFLDATAPPLQQHLRTIRHRVRDMLAIESRAPSAADMAIVVPPRRPRRRPRWELTLAAASAVAAAVLAAWRFAAPPSRALAPDTMATIASRPASTPASSAPSTPLPSRSPPASVSSIPPDMLDSLDSMPPMPERPAPDMEPPPAARTATPTRQAAADETSPLLAGVEEKARVNDTLAAFAASRLANFHREALLVTKSGTLVPGKVSDVDVEVMASCRIEPNMDGYMPLATELSGLLDRTAQRKGTLTSDGLRTSDVQGRDARPHLQRIAGTMLTSSGGLLDIFASDAHERLVSQHAAAGRSPHVSFPTVFLIYDGSLTFRADNGRMMPSGEVAGIRALRWQEWDTLLQQQGSGIVILLESAKNSFRHTRWRWFHLSPSDWATIASHAPRQFKCLLTLTDSSGSTVESDFYPLQQLGVGRADSDQILSLAPFFVNDDFEHYVPEITLTKSVVVLRSDVPRVKDFTATIEETPGPPAYRD